MILSYILLFISTNIDDLVLLHAWFSRKHSFLMIFLGQLIGIGTLVLISSLLSKGLLQLSGEYSYYLSLGGIIPIYLGLKSIFSKEEKVEYPQTSKKSIYHIIISTLANGSDNIAIYIPFFIHFGYKEFTYMSVIFIIMTYVRCLIAQQSQKVAILKNLSPYILVGIGIYILSGLY